MSFNKVILLGNLTRDPELRYTPKGAAVAKLGLAVNRKWKSENGQENEEVSFIDIDAFGKQAELISQYLKKGNPLFLEGRLKLDTWEKDGKKEYKLKVVLESFQFVGGGKQEGQAPQPAQRPAARQAAPSSAAQPADDGSEIPF